MVQPATSRVKAEVYKARTGNYLGIILFPHRSATEKVTGYRPNHDEHKYITLQMKRDLNAEESSFTTPPLSQRQQPSEALNLSYAIPADRALPVMQWLRNGGVPVEFKDGLKETDLEGNRAKLPPENAGMYFAKLTSDELAKQAIERG